MNTQFLRINEVMARTGMSKSLIYLAMSKGQFPKQIPIGSRVVAWTSESIDAWMEEKISHTKQVSAEKGN